MINLHTSIAKSNEKKYELLEKDPGYLDLGQLETHAVLKHFCVKLLRGRRELTLKNSLALLRSVW